jgi:hypothetical protein
MLHFVALEENLVSDAIGNIARKRALLSDIQARGGLGPSRVRGDRDDGDDFDGTVGSPDGGAKNEGMTSYLIQKLDEAVLEFSDQFDRLMDMLRERGDKEEDIARFLSLRLDYSEFYARATGRLESLPAVADEAEHVYG